MTDSIWAIVGGLVKGLGVGVDEVLYEISYANLLLYGAAMPRYTPKDDDENEERLDANDPANKDRVRQLIESFE